MIRVMKLRNLGFSWVSSRGKDPHIEMLVSTISVIYKFICTILLTGRQLGSGAFGRVLKAEVADLFEV